MWLALRITTRPVQRPGPHRATRAVGGFGSQLWTPPEQTGSPGGAWKGSAYTPPLAGQLQPSGIFRRALSPAYPLAAPASAGVTNPVVCPASPAPPLLTLGQHWPARLGAPGRAVDGSGCRTFCPRQGLLVGPGLAPTRPGTAEGAELGATYLPKGTWPSLCSPWMTLSGACGDGAPPVRLTPGFGKAPV